MGRETPEFPDMALSHHLQGLGAASGAGLWFEPTARIWDTPANH